MRILFLVFSLFLFLTGFSQKPMFLLENDAFFKYESEPDYLTPDFAASSFLFVHKPLKYKNVIRNTKSGFDFLFYSRWNRGFLEGLVGAGWQLKESPKTLAEDVMAFDSTQHIWERLNPNYKPKNLIYPDTVKIDLTTAR